MLHEKKIYILDGATGTAIQEYHLSGKDYLYQGKEYKGCHEILNISRQDIILDIHKRYIEAGADIIETNTFNSNPISLKDYGLEEEAYRFSYTGAKLAKEAAKASKRNILVAGSMGPTNKSASIPTKNSVVDREIDFDSLLESYFLQAEALFEGGIDLFLIETIFDGLNAKAAVMACERVAEKYQKKVPIMISATVNKHGKILSGQDIKSLITALDRDSIVSFGLNCSFGAKELIPMVESLDSCTDKYVSIYPNAGLPNENGDYDESPEITLNYLKPLIDAKKINIVGGCCGTTAKHIEKISAYCKGKPPREVDNKQGGGFFLAGSSALEEGKSFYCVGERNNMAGSRKFKRLIEEGKYEEAAEITKEQVENQADIIDINVDDALLDSKKEIEVFLRTLGNDSVITQVPIMIDSSSFEVIERALKNISGKAIVNSISLKDGEKEFLRKAAIIKSYGAAVVVMAFDEEGQAVSFERKIEICKRAYDLLIANGWRGRDIVFDPNILTIGTGREEDRHHAVHFFRATRWIREHLKDAKVSGGLSNISFSFRGNNLLRQAIHERFLEKAIHHGLNMGIVNPNEKKIAFSEELILLVDRLIEGEEVVEEILELCSQMAEARKDSLPLETRKGEEKSLGLEDRLCDKILQGKKLGLEVDLEEALQKQGALEIIQNILMKGLTEVGNRFEKGELYLPQIIKSAVVMEEAVKYLSPFIPKNEYQQVGKGKILMCTVKGDVHDIGKNITKTVLACNGYQVIDLGVMVEKERILQGAIEHKVDAVTLSGLITPSLHEMLEVLELFEEQNLRIPVVIGGAATSVLHTVLKLEPKYKKRVFHVTDASSTVVLFDSLLQKDASIFQESLEKEYKSIREIYWKHKEKGVHKNIDQAVADGKHLEYLPKAPKSLKKHFLNISIDTLLPEIEWTMFLSALKIKGSSQKKEILEEAKRILKEWTAEKRCVKAVYQIFPTKKQEDLLEIEGKKIPLVRNQGLSNESLSDYIEEEDYIGLFVATIQPKEEKDIFQQILANTLIEGASQYLQKYISETNWEVVIRPAIGYPSLPDHSIKKDIFNLLEGEATGAELVGNFAMKPSSTVCGLYLGNPKSKYISPRTILEDQIKKISNIKNLATERVRKNMGVF